MKYLFCILFAAILASAVPAQEVTGWKNYTDMKQIEAVVADSSGVWAATTGGGFNYKISEDTFKTLHKADGLSGESLTAVAADNNGKIWFGSSDGKIDVFNPKDGSINSILDIYNSDKLQKGINNLIVSGDTIIVSTDFGISLIDSKNYTFYDTFFRFGNLSSNIRVNNVIKSGLIYASTVSGVAIQKPGAQNLSAPESWNIYTTSQDLPSDSVNKIIFFRGKLTAATSRGLASFDGTSWQAFLPQFTGNINDLITSGDSLFILSNNRISLYYNGTLSSYYNSPYPITVLGLGQKTGLIAGGTHGIILNKDFNSNNFIYPNCPQADLFYTMSVDNDGVLWCASGSDPAGVGFYKYDGKEWTNYNIAKDTSIGSNAYFISYSAPDNTKYLGNWGTGFLRVKNGVMTLFNSQNTGMLGGSKNSDYLVISGFGTDSQNNLWVLDEGSIDEKTLSVLTTDSTWYHFHVPAMGNQFLDYNLYLAIDQYNTKWFACTNQSRQGLFYFNENGTLDNTNDDISGFLTQSDGLNSNDISCVVVDLRGDVWVGTSAGVNIVSNTGSIVQSNPPELQISSVFTLREQSINCIAVDPINQKWVGTNQGLILVNSDGTSIESWYNSENSPLLSDEIRSIAIDKYTGTVYVGTDLGLTSFKTSSVQPQDSFTKLFLYPSPFVLTGGTNRLTIDGLIKDCNIKIITVSGKLIKDFQTPGGRIAYWDGTDTNGNTVNSGVYLIVAYTPDGNNVFTGKIAVLNKK